MHTSGTVARSGREAAGRQALELGRQLAQVRLFAGLDEATLQELAARAVVRPVARNTLLFRKGESCRGLHVVLEGRVDIYTASPDGREQVLHRIGARQAVTELPLFDGAAYPASARAATAVRIAFLPAAVVESLCSAHPELLRVVIGDLGRSIRRLTQLVEKVSLKDVRARVATSLLEQAASTAVGEGERFGLAGTQEQLAQALGVTRESVARALASLRRAGLIEQQGRRVRILRLERLAGVAEGRDPATSPAAAARGAGSLAGYRVASEGPCC